MKKSLITIAAMTTLLVQFPAYAGVICSNENSAVQASTPTSQFVLRADGTAKDTATNLIWMRCSLGQTWSGSTCTGTRTFYTWQAALQVTQDINSGVSNADNDSAAGFAGHTDWRLPNKNELESIVEQRCSAPSINAAIFPSTPSIYFWSSSPYIGTTYQAWYVRFDSGLVNGIDKSYSNFGVRLVRAGQ